ncbi:MAG: ATP-dependent sacrificial sulfur transferase LarE, partial [Angelakisella sp.]
LLYAAKACGCKVKGYYAKSVFQPRFELDDATRLAKELGVELAVLPLEVLDNPDIRQNRADRCYYCKQAIFTRLLTAAAADGFSVLADGTNASDDGNDRPGMRALAELKVVSPLRLCGITKAQLREYSRLAGLFTWNKPAYACLATRVATGCALDGETLARIERGEQLLTSLGFRDLRLRVQGGAAKIQLPENQLDRAVKMRQDIIDGLAGDFSAVLLDLKAR